METTREPKSNHDLKIALVLFFLGWITFVYFAHGGGWGVNSFMDLTRAVVEQGTFEITDYVQNTGDWAKVEERYLINKNPGTSFLAVPAYFLVHAILPNAYESISGALIATHLTVAFSFSLLCAFCMALTYLWTRRFASVFGSVLVSVVAWLGTLNLGYASLYNAGNVVACCYVIAAFALWQGHDEGISKSKSNLWLWLTGFALGYAILTEPISLVGGLLFIPVLLFLKTPWKKWLTVAAGGLPVGILLAFYNWSCFGSIFATGYQHQNPRYLDEGAFLGVFQAPTLEVLNYITFHPVRGLFWGSPVLLVGLVGIVLLWKEKTTRAQATLVTFMTGAYFLFNASFINWFAGWTVGPRYLSPMIPLFATPIAIAVDRLQILKWLTILLAAGSIFIQLVVNTVNPMVPDMPNLKDPIGHYIFPLFQRDLVSVNNQSVLDYRSEDVFKIRTFKEHWASYNLGEVLGLKGRLSLAPLLFIWLLFGMLLFRQISERKRQ